MQRLQAMLCLAFDCQIQHHMQIDCITSCWSAIHGCARARMVFLHSQQRAACAGQPEQPARSGRRGLGREVMPLRLVGRPVLVLSLRCSEKRVVFGSWGLSLACRQLCGWIDACAGTCAAKTGPRTCACIFAPSLWIIYTPGRDI